MVGGPGLFGTHLIFLLGFLVVVAVVIAVVVLAVHAATRPAYPAGAPSWQMGSTEPPAPETPLQILARRFASGEITAEEYQRARDLLGGGGSS